jgi:transcriptional regulator GlxA family with amidase domain
MIQPLVHVAAYLMEENDGLMAREAAIAPYSVTVLLLEQFAMIAFTSTLEPLREANWVLGRRAFDWTVVSHDGRAVTASNGLSLNVDGSIHDVVASAMVIVCSSFDPHRYITPKILAWLRKFDRQGALIGGIETGAYVLARAGLLDGCRATIHWENAQSMIKAFPKVRLTSGIFEIDGRRFSAAGASAAMDMMLHFIGMRVGRHIASAVAEQFIYNRVRGPESPQRLAAPERVNMRHPRLRRLLLFMDSHLHERLDIAALATAEGISERELRRLCKAYLYTSPQNYHRTLRLERARLMLRQTDLSITSVAANCGFTSSSDFSRAFRRKFGCKPVDDRHEIYVLDRCRVPRAATPAQSPHRPKTGQLAERGGNILRA